MSGAVCFMCFYLAGKAWREGERTHAVLLLGFAALTILDVLEGAA